MKIELEQKLIYRLGTPLNKTATLGSGGWPLRGQRD